MSSLIDTRDEEPFITLSTLSLTGLTKLFLIASTLVTIIDLRLGFGSSIKGEETRLYCFVQTLRIACKLAVTGSAKNAPRAPNTAPIINTDKKATAGFKSMVFSEILGEITMFSIC